MENTFRKGSAILLFIVICGLTASPQTADKAKVIAGAERVFESAAKSYSGAAPGCAVGVSLNGEPVFQKAFGLAEMEHNIPNTAQTIFESGSVAKQFTAAAVVLLQQDGKLNIDDPVRKYVPEFPEYDRPVTIRHLLTHTAGLRDWGSVMSLTGAGRGDRVITQDIAFDVIIRQKHLDFSPGAEYSYSNSGYNLAAVIVERVSKRKFNDFLTERLLKPLGMTHSSIRDDYQRIVPGRAQAYSRESANSPWRLNMPIMNVYGNGGMLTTVGDWLKWNAMLDARTWNPRLVDELETKGVLNDGRKISYALGIDDGSSKELKELSHGGATAGYLTWLARFPEKKVSIAVLCNGAAQELGSVGPRIRDELFGAYSPGPQPAAVTLAEQELNKYVGGWRNDVTRNLNRITLAKGELNINGGVLKPVADGSFMLGERRLWFKAGSPMTAEIANEDGSTTKLTMVSDWKLSSADLNAFSGNWYSDEAQSSVNIAVEGDKSYVVIRPVAKIPLMPIYRDHFSAQGYVVWFVRNAAGKVTEMHVGTGRMRDMLFERPAR